MMDALFSCTQSNVILHSPLGIHVSSLVVPVLTTKHDNELSVALSLITFSPSLALGAFGGWNQIH